MSERQPLLAPACPRCGRPIPGYREIAMLTEGMIERLKSRRLVIPDSVYADLVLIRRSMECRLGICDPGGAR